MKRYKPLFLKEDKNYKNAIQYLTKHFSSQIEIPNEKYDSVLGYATNFITEDATIQSWINENEHEVFLMLLSSKKPEDLKQVAKGTGKGTSFVNMLKQYADSTKKKLILPDATSSAVPFWNKISWLEKDSDVIIDFDGEKYNPPNTYSYTPSVYKK